MPGVDYSKKVLGLITGSSQGIGRMIALQVGRKLGKGSKLILIEKDPTDTRKLVAESNTNITVDVHSMEFSNVNVQACAVALDKSCSGIEKGTYDIGLIFHNAGQIGVLKNTRELTDVEVWKDYYTVNLFAPAILNSAFLNKVRSYIDGMFTVNITSILSIQAKENMAMYCSAKAARNLFFAVLAAEEPDVTVLSYSPGPVNTSMLNTIAEKAQSEKTKGDFQKLKKENKVLSTEETVGKLLKVLEEGKFKSGDFVDYFGRT